MTQSFDVCNGDADGLIARHQFRLSFPGPADNLSLVTGLKRDVSLLSQIEIGSTKKNTADISVFDISYDQNVESVHLLLNAGATIRYFDHHRASLLEHHPRLDAHIDTSADTCTSLIVDRTLNGAHRPWAIAAAFGDNLIGVAEKLAALANLSSTQTAQLRLLGECINYNAYGESISDLFYPPAEIARRMMPYQNPFEFAQCEDILSRLQSGIAGDLRRAQQIQPHHTSGAVAVYLLPDEKWARRVSGTFANLLARNQPYRAHAILTGSANGKYIVSIRAPVQRPQHADAVAIQFANGGGRAAAAGINNMEHHDIARLILLLDETYGELAQ